MPETDILERLKGMECARCLGAGYTKHHQPGHLHYETDYTRIPCEPCAAVRAAIAEITALRQREKEWRALGAETPHAMSVILDIALDATKTRDATIKELRAEVERQGLLLRGKTFPTDGLEGATWRCFHCGFETADPKEAAGHFGDRDEENALCVDWRDLDADGRASEYQSVCGELNGEREENLRLRNRIEGLEHRLLEFENLTYSRFKVRSINDAYNKYDSMEGRALAAEEQLTAMRSKMEAAEGMLRDSAAMLNAAIRIVRPLDLNVKDVELWAEQVKVNMQALSNLDEARKTVMGEESGNA